MMRAFANRFVLAAIALVAMAAPAVALGDEIQPYGGGPFKGDIPIYEDRDVNLTMPKYPGFAGVFIAAEMLPHIVKPIPGHDNAFLMSDGAFYTGLNGGVILVARDNATPAAFTMAPFTDHLGQQGFWRMVGETPIAYCLYTRRPNYIYCNYAQLP